MKIERESGNQLSVYFRCQDVHQGAQERARQEADRLFQEEPSLFWIYAQASDKDTDMHWLFKRQ